jgi:Flp pilus assembly protein TadG
MNVCSSLRRRAAGVKDEKGQAAMELLLVFPTFLLVTLLVIELGLWMYQSVTVSNAVREAARYGAVNCAPDPTCDAATLAAKAAQKSNGILDIADVDAGWVARGNAPGDKGSSVVVHADHTYNFLFFPGISVPVTACADMRVEVKNASAAAGTDCP